MKHLAQPMMGFPLETLAQSRAYFSLRRVMRQGGGVARHFDV